VALLPPFGVALPAIPLGPMQQRIALEADPTPGLLTNTLAHAADREDQVDWRGRQQRVRAA